MRNLRKFGENLNALSKSWFCNLILLKVKFIYSLHSSKESFKIPIEQGALKNVSNYLNTDIYSYLETSGVLIYILMLFILSIPVLIRHLWQLNTVVFQHWCLICAILLT
jgi:hypothetical protein